jgi:hypothetical protein
MTYGFILPFVVAAPQLAGVNLAYTSTYQKLAP